MPSQTFPHSDPWLPPLVEKAPLVPAPKGRRARALVVRVATGVVAGLGSLMVLYFDPWGGDAPGFLQPERHVDLTVAPALLGVMAVMWFVLPRVAYRRRDVLMVLVPIYGAWVVGL